MLFLLICMYYCKWKTYCIYHPLHQSYRRSLLRRHIARRVQCSQAHHHIAPDPPDKLEKLLDEHHYDRHVEQYHTAVAPYHMSRPNCHRNRRYHRTENGLRCTVRCRRKWTRVQRCILQWGNNKTAGPQGCATNGFGSCSTISRHVAVEKPRDIYTHHTPTATWHGNMSVSFGVGCFFRWAQQQSARYPGSFKLETQLDWPCKRCN